MTRIKSTRSVLAVGLTAFLLTLVAGAQQSPLDVIPPEPLIFAGSGPGGGLLRVFQADGTQVVTAAPFGAGFSGGIRSAAGDVNGDGVTDVVVAWRAAAARCTSSAGRTRPRW